MCSTLGDEKKSGSEAFAATPKTLAVDDGVSMTPEDDDAPMTPATASRTRAKKTSARAFLSVKKKKPKPQAKTASADAAAETPAAGKRRKRAKFTLAKFFHDILRRLHPSQMVDGARRQTVCIGKSSCKVLERLVNHLFHELLTDAGSLTRIAGHATLTENDILLAVKQRFDGKFGSTACKCGLLAVKRHKKSFEAAK